MIVKSILPEGLTMRPATPADFESIYDLVRAYELVHFGKVISTLEDIRTGWTGPDTNLEEYSRLVFDQSGRLVAYAQLDHARSTKFYVGMCLHPDYSDQRLGDYLLELVESWARERMALAEPGMRVTMNGWLPSGDRVGRQRYERVGLQEIRRFWTMEIEMNAEPSAPIWPSGIELRPYVPQRDERAVFEVIDAAFQDHWGHISNRFEEWKHWTLERENFDPTLWFVAYAGEQIVGGSFCVDEGELGWVDDLAVLRSWRGKGLGMALLLHSFGEFYRRGKRKVGLGVDSQNLTGALRLYQRAGMQQMRENISYEKELRAGVELSTRSLAD